MSISGIDCRALGTTPLSSATTANKPFSAPAPATGAISGHHHRHARGSELMQAVRQTLSEMGIILPTGGEPAASQPADVPAGGNGSADAHRIAQDMHKLMHDLYAAVHQSGHDDGRHGEGHEDHRGSSRYADFATRLQNLIQQLGSGAPSDNSAVAALKADFQRLVSDVKGKTPPAPTPTAPSPTTPAGSTTPAGAPGTAAPGSTETTTTPAPSATDQAGTAPAADTAKTGTTGSPSAAVPGSQAISLLSFLQNLLNNLQRHGSPASAAVGTLINTSG